MGKTFSKSAPIFSSLYTLAGMIQSGTKDDILGELRSIKSDPVFIGKIGWPKVFDNLLETIEDKRPRFSIFAKSGNSKLPFISFSTLPGVTCPRAGECLGFCYSFRAWRFPASFARQAQNAFLMRFHGGIIREEFDAISAKRTTGFDFRLYVDGDFASAEDVGFWFSALTDNPKVRAYGYSKSFREIIEWADFHGGRFPDNYRLNISSGYSPEVSRYIPIIRLYPITRGDFVAVSIGRKVKASDHSLPEHQKVVRQAIKEQAPDFRVFACPGKCGSCTPAGHACGSSRFAGVTIAIAKH